VDDQSPLTTEFEPNDFEEVPGVVRSNSKHSRRISVRLDIDQNKRLNNGVLDGLVIDPVLVRRPVDLHTDLS
jgi:hypothetical protein